jgi:cytochrome d ubiquinol oxidase subunit I
MSDFLFARSQMAMSLAFHIIFAAVGIAMPLLMVIAEGLWLRTKDETYLTLARRWSKGTAIMFAIGAVSGTVLSFELGLLWPKFMEYAGAIIGMPFSLEGFAFFMEAIFLGIYLYGWERVPAKVHWLSGVGVLISGTLSGIFVVTANAWMNTPAGFDLVDGKPVNIDPFAAMLNPAALTQTLHMTIAAFQAVAFLVAGIHAYMLLRDRDNLFHRHAFAIALTVGAIMSVIQPVVGDMSAKHVAQYQPIKLAALEGQWETEKSAPLRIGGLPDEENEVTRYALEIPYGLSFLAFGDPHAEVMGLKEVPEADRPPVAVTHIAFQIMVGLGMFMMGVGLLGGWLAWRRKRLPDAPWYLWLVTVTAPMGIIAIEAGWTVTEVGRQPWVVYGLVRTADAVTPMTGLVVPFVTFTLLYLVLWVAVVVLLKRQVFDSPLIRPSDQNPENSAIIPGD